MPLNDGPERTQPWARAHVENPRGSVPSILIYPADRWELGEDALSDEVVGDGEFAMLVICASIVAAALIAFVLFGPSLT